MRKSMLIVNSLLLALLVCFTFFNFTLLLYAEGPKCEETGVRECEEETRDYCFDFCDTIPERCDYYYFVSGECGCSGTCTQWWYWECTGGEVNDIYECITAGHGCWMK